jgi:hypothetical protein
MNWGGPEFVLWIIGLSTLGWVANNWIRARHGYALEDEWGGKTARQDKDLVTENAQLRERLGVMEDRVIVLERIATDKHDRLSSAIEELREPATKDGAVQ